MRPVGFRPLDSWKAYLRWNVIDSAAPLLSSPFVSQDFAFRQTVLSGTKENLPRWQRCVRSADQHVLPGIDEGRCGTRGEGHVNGRSLAGPGTRNQRASLRMIAEDGTPLQRRYFCEKQDREVSRDEIVDRVWKGRIVSDAAISSRTSPQNTSRRSAGRTRRYQDRIERQDRDADRRAGVPALVGEGRDHQVGRAVHDFGPIDEVRG